MTEKDLEIQNLRRENEWLKKRIELAERTLAETEKKLPRWISVEDRLPERMQDVLMFFNSDCVVDGNMAVGFLTDTDEHLTFWGAWCDGGWNMKCDETPTFWMPLPEAPERKVNNG